MKVRVNGKWFECDYSWAKAGATPVVVGILTDIRYVAEPVFSGGEVFAVARNPQAWLPELDPDCQFKRRKVLRDICINCGDDGRYGIEDVPDGIRQKCLQILQEMKNAEYV